MTALYVLIWLLVGYAWTYVWVNHILENKRFNDTGTEPGPSFLIIMTAVGPAFAVIAAILVTLEFVFTKTGPTIKRLYGMK